MNTRHASQPFWLILPAVFLAAMFTGETATSQSPATGTVKTSDGLTVVTFKVDAGTIKVNLPDDMAAGDTISGTVVAEPKGNNEAERSQNLGALKGYAVEVKAPKFPSLGPSGSTSSTTSDTIVFVADTGPNRIQRSTDGGKTWQIIGSAPGPGNSTGFTHQLPQAAGDRGSQGLLEVSINRLDQGGQPPGQVLTTTSIPDYDFQGHKVYTRPDGGSSFQLPAIGQTGRTVEILGPFDGNSSTTTINFKSVQDFEKNTESVSGGFGLILPLAESPRKVVFQSPANVTGPIELVVKDANSETSGTYRNLGLRLSAPKVNLVRGERTTLTVEVQGLKGIKDPVPLTLESKGVITMEGGMFQPLYIQPSEVTADGRYTATRGITGVQTGGWEATATVVTQPFNIVLRDPDPPQMFLFNSFTGSYAFCGAGIKLTGTGQIKRQGCMIALTDDHVDRQVIGTLNSCVPVDNAKFWVFCAEVLSNTNKG